MAGNGRLASIVLEYTRTIESLVSAVEAPADWAPLAGFVAVGEFERIGTFLEVQNWEQYTEMLTRWALATTSFEAVVRRLTEAAGLVYFEIEERHLRDGNVHAVNSMTVFGFAEGAKIRHLDVYLQQPR